jgi:glycosyltransferase involved in cell wall biosynthesis
MKAMQIGMGATVGGMGGLDRYYFDLVRALPAVGTQVKGYVFGDTGGTDGITNFAADGASLLGRWAGLRSAVAGSMRESDVVVSHFASHAFGMLDQIGKKPFVVHFHGPWASESAAEGAGALSVAAKRTLERIVYSRGARFIVLSKAFGLILEREYGVPQSAIRVVPGGVDVRRFAGVGSREQARRRLGWPADRPTVVTVRRLVRAKGLENLIEATKTIRARIPDVLVVIAGTGPLESELKRRVAEGGLEHNVRFEGFVADEALPSVYRAADLFVVPTITLEGFGLVVIEALACGTPVVVTPVGGLPEVVAELDPRLVLGSTEPAELARGIAAALDGTLVLPSEDACRAYARRFDWPTIAARVNDVYQEVVR